MLKFEPPVLEAEFRDALARITDEISVRFEGDEIGRTFELDDFDDVTFTASTRIKLVLPRGSDETDLSIQSLIKLVRELTAPQTSFDGILYHSNVRTVVKVLPRDMRSISFSEKIIGELNYDSKIITQAHNDSVSFSLKGLSLYYGISVVVHEYFYDKYNPPMSSNDVFIEVTHPNGLGEADAKAIINAYLFELHATLGLEYSEASVLYGEIEHPDDEEINDLVRRARNLRPLLLGQGLAPILQEFNRGCMSFNSEPALLYYVKCIEYVSATVVRERQYEDLRKRLLSRDALNPSSDFLDGLLTLFEENRILTRDAEALKLTVERCCDPLPIALYAPKFLRLLAAITPKCDDKNRKSALSELAEALSASRNQLAHSKANYKVTGKECPSDQIDRLVTCAKMTAEQCIRWYASRSPELRKGAPSSN